MGIDPNSFEFWLSVSQTALLDPSTDFWGGEKKPFRTDVLLALSDALLLHNGKGLRSQNCRGWKGPLEIVESNPLLKKKPAATVLISKCCITIAPPSSLGGSDISQVTEFTPAVFQICTSCCEGTICNLPLPRNASDAVFTTLSPLSSTPGLSGRAVLTAVCLLLGLMA